MERETDREARAKCRAAMFVLADTRDGRLTDAAPQPAENPMAIAEFFLKIDSIDGESTVKGFEKQIQLDSFSWGLSETIVVSGGGGSSAGRPVQQPFQFTAKVSAASPKLMVACATGQHLASAVLSVRRPGAKDVFLKYTLSDLLVSSYKTAANVDTDPAPFDAVALNCGKVQVEYRPENGTPGTVVAGGFDFQANKKI